MGLNVLLFGATGMVGQGVLRACLLDPQVVSVAAVGRTTTGRSHAKLREVVLGNLWDYGPIEDDLRGFDACFFCMGVSAAGMTEHAYAHMTYDVTVAAAETLHRLNPAMTFIYVSGAGTDSTEKGRQMWARVKGATENALLKMGFARAVMFRPGIIEPVHGERSKTRAYQLFYWAFRPVLPLLRRLFPGSITTTEAMGRAMIAVARGADAPSIIGPREINDLGRNAAAQA